LNGVLWFKVFYGGLWQNLHHVFRCATCKQGRYTWKRVGTSESWHTVCLIFGRDGIGLTMSKVCLLSVIKRKWFIWVKPSGCVIYRVAHLVCCTPRWSQSVIFLPWFEPNLYSFKVSSRPLSSCIWSYLLKYRLASFYIFIFCQEISLFVWENTNYRVIFIKFASGMDVFELVMGPGPKFLVWVGSIFLLLGSGQPSLVWIWVSNIFPENS